MGFGLRGRLERMAAAHPIVRRALTRVHLLWTDHLPSRVLHPLDRMYGVRTQAHVPLYLNATDVEAGGQIIPYGGCVASALRRILIRFGPWAGASFIDIGCGKGRALVVASEFTFGGIVGIELNPDVAARARANARRMRRCLPGRTAIQVRVGDASLPDLPEGRVVVFLYHPFGRMLVGRLCAHLALAAEAGRSIMVIYENPVHGAVFDGHPSFKRVYAAMLPCDEDEEAFAFDPVEAFIVWRCGDDADGAATGWERPIVTVKADFRVVLGVSARS